MRPVKLTMSAFGPYADETQVDFDALGRSGVYLVCGDTGAGKTMIFDAICFALFGEASGDSKAGARSTASLRSDYAAGTTRTFVELLFDYRGQRYRVKRNPEYLRAKKNGSGETREAASAELEFPDGRVVSGVRKVTAEIEGLLGIDSDQFKQIVMLAQGEFRKLLTADTDAREVIFRRLFGTEVHEMLQVALAEESRGLDRENQQVKARIAGLAQSASFVEGSEQAQELERRRRGEGQLGSWLRDELEAVLAVDKPRYVELDGEVEKLRVRWSEANTLLKQVENRPVIEQEKARLAAQEATLVAAAPQLAAVLEEQKAYDAERSQAVERAAIVEGTFPKYEELGRAEHAHEAARREVAQARRGLDEAQAADKQAQALFERLGEETHALEGADVRLVKVQADCDAAARDAEAARTLLANVRTLERKQADAQAASTQVARLKAVWEDARDAEAATKDALTEARAMHKRYGDAAAQLAEANAAFETTTRNLAEADGLMKQRACLEAECAEAEGPFHAAQVSYRAAETAHGADLAHLNDMQRQQRAGRAGLLAAELEEGAPCPVCGSTHHPSPAGAHGSIPTDAEIDAAAADEARSKAAATAASNDVARLKAVFEEKRAALAAFDEAHGGVAGVKAGLEAAAEQHMAARQTREAAVSRVDEATAAAQALEGAEARHEAASTALNEAHEAFRVANEAAIAAENAAQALRDTLGEVDAVAAQTRNDEAGQRLAAAQEALANAQGAAEAHARKRDELASAGAQAQAAHTRAAEARDALLQRETAEALAAEKAVHLKADLEYAGLAEAQAEASRLRARAGELKAARDAAEAAVRDNEAQRHTTAELLKAKEQQLASIPVVDVEETMHAMEGFHRQADALKADAVAVKTRIDANERCLAGLRKALDEAGGIEERYGRVKLLADAATGNLAGKTKIRFEAYVQAIYFDKVIAAANERLKILTSGQLELVRYSDGDGRSKAGLGLYVIDSFTGRARDASSLSGGESFQASLCLALGLSDIVQAHAGGVEFDTMFVDEGFGSLDQGALGNAISLLSDLSGGTKLVGIISHVEDLKANIPKKIVVTKNRTGSSVAMEK